MWTVLGALAVALPARTALAAPKNDFLVMENGDRLCVDPAGPTPSRRVRIPRRLAGIPRAAVTCLRRAARGDNGAVDCAGNSRGL
jgi:hypothetical protein